MSRLYNKTNKDIPKICVTLGPEKIKGYSHFTDRDAMRPGDFFPNKRGNWRLSKHYAICFDGDELHHILLRSDYNKLTLVK